MITDISSRIENSIVLNKDSVWVLSDFKQIDYSDGILSERYLKKVFSRAKDLSSKSHELEQWIKDWPSEYHLSRKRSQLLSGFDFDKTKKVLEVGCGCGAITRFLGETFDDVVSIEGSLARAGIARLRTNGMDNVSILCAPFQNIIFKDKFDIVFCIGVFEYSGSFINAPDPYDAILHHFEKLLNPDGIIVLAIENQFGLKYFSTSTEDHTNRMFEGIEGYPHFGNKIRTFGYDELNFRLSKYFSNIDFYFPYPDYKIPSCILSEKIFEKVNIGELIGRFKPQDYSTNKKPLFNENLVYLELDKNKKLPFFSNSFLVVAGKQEICSMKSQALGILYTTDRAQQYKTTTRFIEQADKSIIVDKCPINKNNNISENMLRIHPTVCKWESGLSLQGLIAQRIKRINMSIGEIFSPCKIWVNKLKTLSVNEINGIFLDGKYIDCIWSNCFLHDDECVFVDQEWEWEEKISLNVLVIKAIYCFLDNVNRSNLHPSLRKCSTKLLIKRIARSIGIEVGQDDFTAFAKLESKFYGIVGQRNITIMRLKIELCLFNRSLYMMLINVRDALIILNRQKERIINYAFRFLRTN